MKMGETGYPLSITRLPVITPPTSSFFNGSTRMLCFFYSRFLNINAVCYIESEMIELIKRCTKRAEATDLEFLMLLNSLFAKRDLTKLWFALSR